MCNTLLFNRLKSYVSAWIVSIKLFFLKKDFGDLSNIAPCKLGNEIFSHNIDFIARNHRRHFYHDHDY